MSAEAAWWLERIAADGSAPAVPVNVLAEGIEAELCRQMGFRLMRGYLFGKPVPAATL